MQGDQWCKWTTVVVIRLIKIITVTTKIKIVVKPMYAKSGWPIPCPENIAGVRVVVICITFIPDPI